MLRIDLKNIESTAKDCDSTVFFRFKGAALLTALFIMTLVAIVATAMSTKLQLDIYRTQLTLNHDKLYLASQAVTFWAISELSDKNNHFTKNYGQGVVGNYPKNMEHLDNSVLLSGSLYDLQARFNLNNLINKKSMLGFINFINVILPKTSQAEKMTITLALNDWLSPYDLARGKDNYLSYYLNQKPPYYSSHQLMNNISEFRLIKGVNAPIYLAFEPYISALPEPTPINLNTASKPVLMSLSRAMNEDQLDTLIKMRKKNGIKNTGKINDLLRKLNISNEQITLESQYFLNIAYAKTNTLNLTVYTVLKRNLDKQGKLTVSVLNESFNVF